MCLGPEKYFVDEVVSERPQELNSLKGLAKKVDGAFITDTNQSGLFSSVPPIQ